MIFIREAKKEDQNNMMTFIQRNQLDQSIVANFDDNIYFLVLDKNQILGFSKYEMIEENNDEIKEKEAKNLTHRPFEEAKIKFLFIEEKHRRQYLGDGLFRATLNHMRGIQVSRFIVDIDKTQIVDVNSITAFFKWEDIRMNQLMDIEAFFSRQCRGGK